MTIRITPKTINPKLIDKIREISGEDIGLCMQCGTCSGVCPMYAEIAVAPRVVLQMAQLGLEEELAKQSTASTCAACSHCQSRCPRGVDLVKVMEAIRLLTLRQNIDLLKVEDIPAEDIDEMPAMALVAAFRKLTA